MTTTNHPPLSKPADGSGVMFDGIASKYDLLNRINSLGLDRGWRRAAIRSLELQPGDRVLDLATGTADLPLEMLKVEPKLQIVGLDPSRGMLAVGDQKLLQAEAQDRVELVYGDACELPYPDNAFQGITMAFGIRNVPDRSRALREMARVLAPGRRAAILELSEPRNGFLAWLARLHVQLVVPATGALLSGSREYRYLRTSIEAFPRPEAFESMMREAGLRPLERRSFAFGACVLFVATKEAQVS